MLPRPQWPSSSPSVDHATVKSVAAGPVHAELLLRIGLRGLVALAVHFLGVLAVPVTLQGCWLSLSTTVLALLLLVLLLVHLLPILMLTWFGVTLPTATKAIMMMMEHPAALLSMKACLCPPSLTFEKSPRLRLPTLPLARARYPTAGLRANPPLRLVRLCRRVWRLLPVGV